MNDNLLTRDEKIKRAADLLADALYAKGWPTPTDCEALAARIFELWERDREIRNLPAGEIAQHFRARHSYTLEELQDEPRLPLDDPT